MADSGDEFTLPPDLPEPTDDGAADHLQGIDVPSIPLSSTAGGTVDLSTLSGRTVVYCYPKTGRPDADVIPAGWDGIPGARGCTPEACSFRDTHRSLLANGVDRVFGLSLQSTAYQREARNRIGLPYELLSDANRELSDRLGLPTFTVERGVFLVRLTLVLREGRVEHVFYPVFPPDEHAAEVLEWVTDSACP